MIADEHRTNEELFLAVQYCRSVVPLERARSLDVLAQFGAGPGKLRSERPHFDERLAIAMEHLRDESANVATSAAWALAHLGGDAAISALIEMRTNSDPDVRWAVAVGMEGSERVDAIATLIEDRLSADEWIEGDEMAARRTLDLPIDTPAEELCDGLRKLLLDHFPR